MATVKRFEDLIAWQRARTLNHKIYVHILVNNKVSLPLKDQIDSAAGSIMDQFLSVAKGSCGEVKSQLYRAFDREFISKGNYDGMSNLLEEVAKIITGLIKYLNNSSLKGNKYIVSEDEILYNITDQNSEPTLNSKP